MPVPSLPDLFQMSLDDVEPASGQNGPRLWVRRLVIWSEPDHIIRDVSLRPGLNIIWSPDGTEEDRRMGHGGGKTTFCRLMRYCLGEDSFGSREQRQLIVEKLPDAHVGAEIVLDGELWVVVRPIRSLGGRHLAQKGGALETAFTAEMPNSGMSPLRRAIAAAIMPDAVRHMPVGSDMDQGWEAALAWISRDQECRLTDILNWRVPQTESNSPSRRLSKADRTTVIRLLLNALTAEEIEESRAIAGYEQTANSLMRQQDRVEWARGDMEKGLAETFGVEAPELWDEHASDALRVAQQRFNPGIAETLAAARSNLEEAQKAVTVDEERLKALDGQLREVSETLRILSNKLPVAVLQVIDARDPRCPCCGRPIDAQSRDHVENQIKIREELAAGQRDATLRQSAWKSEQDTLKFGLAARRQEVAKRKLEVDVQTKAVVEQAGQMSAAQSNITLTVQYRRHLAALEKLKGDLTKLQDSKAIASSRMDECRRSAQSIIERLSNYFDAVIRYLLPDGAKGIVALNADGIHPRVEQHGALTTAAVESLKVVAFDLAALILCIEGRAQLPGIWIHDSPREADLGLLLYFRFFYLARLLERKGATPLFQYVITTTTEPPPEFQTKPWMRLQLRSTPAEERLFGRNL